MTTLDWASRSRMSLELGPVELPSPEAFRAAIVQLAGIGTRSRVGLALDGPDHWRVLGRELPGRVADMVRVPPVSGVGLRAWLEQTWVPDLPVQFAIDGDRVAFVADHRLMDANLASMLVPVLVDLARGGSVPPALHNDDPHPLARALAHTFGEHPGTALDLARDLRASRRAASASTDEEAIPDSARPMPQDAGVRHLVAVMERPALATLRRSYRGLGLSPKLLVLAAAALRLVGIPIDRSGVMVVDLRRYLPPGVDTLGNFITGTPLPLYGAGSSPEELAARVDRALELGRPLVATAARVAKGGLIRAVRHSPPSQASDAAADGPWPNRANVSLSNSGLLRGIEKLPWLVPPQERVLEVLGDAVDPQGVGFLACMIDGRLRVGVTFRAESFAPEAIGAALDLMTTRPAEVLDTH